MRGGDQAIPTGELMIGRKTSWGRSCYNAHNDTTLGAQKADGTVEAKRAG